MNGCPRRGCYSRAHGICTCGQMFHGNDEWTIWQMMVHHVRADIYHEEQEREYWRTKQVRV